MSSLEPTVRRTSKSNALITHYRNRKGGSHHVPSPEQAKKQAKIIMERLDTKNYVAQQVEKYEYGGKIWYTAYLYKDISEKKDRSILNRTGTDNFWLGRIVQAVPGITKDEDQRSETYGQHVTAYIDIDEGGAEPTQYPLLEKMEYYSYLEATAEHAKLLQAMEGRIDGKYTELVVRYPDTIRGPPPSRESFWTDTPEQMAAIIREEAADDEAQRRKRNAKRDTREPKNNP